MVRPLILLASHAGMLLVGFALGVYPTFPKYPRDKLTLPSQTGVCKRDEAVLAMSLDPYGTLVS